MTETSDELAIVRDERTTIVQRIEALDARMKPLQEQRATLFLELRAANELIAELAVTDIEIRDSRNTETGHKRFGDLVRALHPAITSTYEWSPIGDYSETDAELLPAPVLYLEHGLNTEYSEALADALKAYVERFLPGQNRPILFDVMAYDYGEEHQWKIQYDAATGDSVLRDDRRYSGVEPHGGILADVIDQARLVAWGFGGPREED